ncbi:MAG: cell division protein FtsB [Acidobacteria bacterium]|nr:MAG: cell division protein FtsB [Acidobacteriota bacterium]
MSYNRALTLVVKEKDQLLSLFEDRARNDVGLRKKAATLGSLIALIALVVGSFFGDRGFLRMVAQRERAESLRREIEMLRSENSRLAVEIVALKSDPRAIERLAREELGLARPGETVFSIREEEPSPR